MLTGVSGDLRHAFRLLWKGKGLSATTRAAWEIFALLRGRSHGLQSGSCRSTKPRCRRSRASTSAKQKANPKIKSTSRICGEAFTNARNGYEQGKAGACPDPTAD
jgi:hypothetical protein